MTLDEIYCQKHFEQIAQTFPEWELLKEVKDKRLDGEVEAWSEIEFHDQLCSDVTSGEKCKAVGEIIVKWKRGGEWSDSVDDKLVPITASIKDNEI